MSADPVGQTRFLLGVTIFRALEICKRVLGNRGGPWGVTSRARLGFGAWRGHGLERPQGFTSDFDRFSSLSHIIHQGSKD